MTAVVSTSIEVLDQLFREHTIRLTRGALLDRDLAPKPRTFDVDRVRGMMLGLAIGDALGEWSESISPPDRRAKYGEIRDYRSDPRSGLRVGYPSDDSQLAFWTLDQLLADGRLIPERLADRFVNGGHINGIGKAMQAFIRNYRAGMPWRQSGTQSAGNGALMRIAPVLVPHLRTGGRALWADVALAAMLTHNDASSTAACLGFTAMLWELLDADGPPPTAWWVDRYVSLTADLEGEAQLMPRGGKWKGAYCGPLWRFVREAYDWAEDEQVPTVDACNATYSGAYLLETVPCALLILARYAHDPEEAIVRAVNDTRDNDTVAAIVGACVGALHGTRGLPPRWISGLSGRTAADDDGRMHAILACVK
jgi:ADP-ribosyl-[dinitrogen reductase] hydrolase